MLQNVRDFIEGCVPLPPLRAWAPEVAVTQRPSGLFVPRVTPRYPHPMAIDLFCGMGGFSLGFIQAGFTVVCGADNDPPSAATYMYNLGAYPIEIHFVEPQDETRLEKFLERDMTSKKGGLHRILTSGGGWRSQNRQLSGVPHFWFGDLSRLSGERLLDALGLEVGEVDCVMGGPPCQGFSSVGKRRVMDPRNPLVFEFARLVVEMRPRTMVMENVPDIESMVTPEGLPVVDALCRILEDGGMGTFNSLRKGLLASSHAGAVLRGPSGKDAKPSDLLPKSEKKRKEPKRPPEPEKPRMF